MPPADLTRRDAARLGLAVGTGFCAAHALGLGIARADVPTAAHEPDPRASFGDPAQLAREFEAAGCIVQHGSFQELDTLKLASEGKLISCFGNNAGSTYLVNFLPPAPNQKPAAAVPEHGWPAEEPSPFFDPDAAETFPANPYFSPAGWSYKLRPDEAVVMAGPMPPECVYFSLINYVLLSAVAPDKDYANSKGFFQVSGPEDVGDYHPVFGSLGMPCNQFRMATEATPGGGYDPASDGKAAFGARFVYVMTGDTATLATVTDALEAAGFGEGIVNTALLPATELAMGLERGKDTFCTLGRVSQPADRDAMDAWIAGLPDAMTVLRVTPQVPNTQPAPAQPVVTRGTDVHEAGLLPQARATMDTLRQAIIAQYADEYDYEEPAVEIAVPEGMTAYLNDRNAQGDNHDTTYLMTGDFTLDSDDDFVVVYGVNHSTTGKAVYSNAILYARPMLNGVCSVYDGLFEGSADAYLPGLDESGHYYAYKMARQGWGGADEFTATIPWSTGNEQGAYYGVDNGSPVLAAFRAYVEKATGVGASYYEIVWDRAIVFHKR